MESCLSYLKIKTRLKINGRILKLEKLLEELEQMGYTEKHLDELRNIIKANDCDLYDVLSHLAFQAELIPRTKRAQKATVSLSDYSKNQRSFRLYSLKIC